MTDMIVSGAGTSAVNGTYVENGTSNGKPKYTYGNYELGVYYVNAIDDNNWVIREISAPPTTYYFNLAGNVPDTPDLVSSWRKEYGASPTPTVTSASSGTTHEGEVALSSLSYLRTKKA